MLPEKVIQYEEKKPWFQKMSKKIFLSLSAFTLPKVH